MKDMAGLVYQLVLELEGLVRSGYCDSFVPLLSQGTEKRRQMKRRNWVGEGMERGFLVLGSGGGGRTGDMSRLPRE